MRRGKTKAGNAKVSVEKPEMDALMADNAGMNVEVMPPRPPRYRMQRLMNQVLLTVLDRPSADVRPPRRRPVSPAGVHKRFLIRVEFSGIEPSIWRRFCVPGDLQARDLVKVVRKVAGWSGAHMDAVHFPREAPYMGRALLVQERLQRGDSFRYTYDFGDSWSHELLVESVELVSVAERGAMIIAGERACPPDDCHGPEGYARLCLALSRNKPGSQILRWLKEVSPGFDPEAFDADARNRRSLSRLSLRFGVPPEARRKRR